jgi:hypothetical protein
VPTVNDNFSDNDFSDDDLIESRIGVHDSNHFEVKLDYSIRSHGRSRYDVDYYFFVPKSLGVNEHTYRDEQFFSDVQAYIRFKTPERTLANLSGEDSLLESIGRLAERVRNAPRDKHALQDLTYEIRMFGCVLRANVRDRVKDLGDKLRSLNGSSNSSLVLLKDAGEITSRLVHDIETCMSSWRELRSQFVDGRLPTASNETFAYVDEFVGLVVEMKLATLLRRIDAVEQELGDELGSAREECKKLLLSERNYRTGAGYSTVTGENEDDHFVYRQGLLKKFVMSVLWLDISKQKEGKRVANIWAAIAAGFAMFFALTATIFAGEYYGINSWNFIVAGVGTYILKDRIKDWMKIFLGARFKRFLADYSIRIRDPITDASIGRCRESFGFIESDEVPDEVLRFRRKEAKVSIEAMAKPEVVMHYSKQVNLRGKDIIERMHLEDYNLNDIVRFSLSQFLVRADDPTSSISYFIEETDSVERRDFRKVYHLNLIMSLRSKGAKRAVLKRVRVIFDKKSIRELQEVE